MKQHIVDITEIFSNDLSRISSNDKYQITCSKVRKYKSKIIVPITGIGVKELRTI